MYNEDKTYKKFTSNRLIITGYSVHSEYQTDEQLGCVNKGLEIGCAVQRSSHSLIRLTWTHTHVYGCEHMHRTHVVSTFRTSVWNVRTDFKEEGVFFSLMY